MKKELQEKSLNIVESIIDNRTNYKRGDKKMGKSISIYLGDNAISVLDRIKIFFLSFGYTPTDSGIVASALTTYDWYLQAKQNPAKCPNAACGEVLNDVVFECPACRSPIRWVPLPP